MRALTVGGLSILGMLCSSALVVEATTPTQVAEARPISPPGPAAPPATVSLPGALGLEARLGHATLPASGRPETYLLFRVTAPPSATPSQPIHVVTLVDRSGSMRGRRLDNALRAARGLVSRLRDGDRITLLAYDTEVRTLLPTTTLDAASRGRALARLESAQASGNTCISCGLEAALAELERSTGHVPHVLLLSDGEATAGERSLDGFQRLARRAREHAVGVSSIGIDLDYNEALLSTLARFSNGQHHFARDAAELEQAFDKELASLTSTAATDAVLEVELPQGVEVVRVFDREVERDGQRLRVRLGSFSGDDEKTLLVQIRLPEGGVRPGVAAEFGLSYQSGGRAEKSRGSLGVRFGEQGSELDPVVALRLARSRTGAALFEAGKLFRSGSSSDFAAADAKLGEALDALAKQAPKAGVERAELDRQAGTLDATRKRLRDARGGRCGCSPGDLSCAMSCSAGAKSGRPKADCAPGDPLCGDVGELSPAEKAAAKQSVSASNPFSR